MFINPERLAEDPDRLEGIEKGSMRLAAQAVYDFRETAVEIFHRERDLAGDIGEDITREAPDRVGVSKIEARLFGKIDYKRARYVFKIMRYDRRSLWIQRPKSSKAKILRQSKPLKLRCVFAM